MRTFFSQPVVRYVFLFPTAFFISYFAVNSAFLNQPYQEMGDLAANALQIMRASEGREMLGAYSRFQVNHIGPITFYYLGWIAKPLFFVVSEHGKYSIGILLYNYAFLCISLFLLYKKLEVRSSLLALTLSLFVCLAAAGPDIFSSIWGPSVILFPMFLFIVSCLFLKRGMPEGLLWSLVSGTFIVQNQIGGLTIVVPMFLICGGWGIYSLGWKKYISSREHWKFFGIGLLFALIAFLPPIIQEIQSFPGNLSKVLALGAKNKTVHKPGPVFEYLFSYYLGPFPLLTKIPKDLILGVLILLPGIYRERLHVWEKDLYSIFLIGFFLSLFGAFKLQGGLVSHVYWFEYVFAAVLYYLNFRLLASLVGKISVEKQSRLYKAVLFLLVLVTLRLGKADFTYVDSPEKFLDAMQPQKDVLYKIEWGFGDENHIQGHLATGVVLRMARQQIPVCVSEKWNFLFPEDYRCEARKNAPKIKRVVFETLDPPSPEFRAGKEGVFEYKNTRMTLMKQ
ncbi:hypothetical protein [Leptospira perolatii]|nr:hypothetical protein [Leptospira perolatii]